MAAGETVEAEDGTVTVWLHEPVKVDGKEGLSVTLRKPVGRDLRTLKTDGDGIDIGQLMDLAGRLCGLLPGQMDDMNVRDVMLLQGVAGDFFGGS